MYASYSFVINRTARHLRWVKQVRNSSSRKVGIWWSLCCVQKLQLIAWIYMFVPGSCISVVFLATFTAMQLVCHKRLCRIYDTRAQQFHCVKPVDLLQMLWADTFHRSSKGSHSFPPHVTSICWVALSAYLIGLCSIVVRAPIYFKAYHLILVMEGAHPRYKFAFNYLRLEYISFRYWALCYCTLYVVCLTRVLTCDSLFIMS